MIQQTTEKAETFRALHVPGRPIVLFNAWDPGSAKAVAAAGTRAVGTSSWGVANALGFTDGEQTPLNLVIDNLARIVRAVSLPVTIDLESGYGATPDAVAASVAQTVAVGAVGCNLEDSFPDTGKLRSIAEQVERIRHARQASAAYFINARTDVFFQPGSASEPGEGKLAEVLERAHAYAEAGADGIFVPGLADEVLIGRLVAESPLPVNILAGPERPLVRRLAELGVARVSYGAVPWRMAMKALEEAAREAAQMS